MAEYTEYHPLKFWLDPASIAEIVAHIQTYLVNNPINSTTEIETIIHDYLIAHPEIIGGVRSINGETGEVVLTADNISAGENVTIKDVLDSLQDQIDDIVASIPSDYQQLIDDVSDLKSALNGLEDNTTINDYSTILKIYPTDTKVKEFPNVGDISSVYVPVISGASYTVTKGTNLTDRFAVGTTENVPAYNEPVIDFVRNDTANEIELTATGNSHYMLIWFRRSSNTGITPEGALATITITQKYGANDQTARNDISEVAEKVDNITSFLGNVTVLQPSTSIYNLPDKTETVYKGELTNSVKDGILSLNGVLTQTGFTLTLPSVALTGYNTVNVEVISGSYTGNVFFFLPIGGNAFFANLSRSTQRTEYFDGTELAVSFYAANGATFDNYKVRIWIKEGLFNAPYEDAHYALTGQKVVACSALEFNTPMYSRLDDDTLYNIFGDRFAVCKNGSLSRYDSNDITKFALLSDLHYTANDEAFYRRVYSAIGDVDYYLMTGDIIDSGYYNTPGPLQTQIGVYKASMSSVGCPVFPFAGNHDDDVNEFAHHGVVDFGPVRFIYFWADYITTQDNPGGHTGDVKQSELDWIEDRLEESNAKYKILMCHYPISTDTGFDTYFVNATVRATIEALASEYGVKLYLNGHQHDHSISDGTAGVMTDINLPNGKYAYCICTIDSNGLFTLVAYKSDDDSVLKTVTVQL